MNIKIDSKTNKRMQDKIKYFKRILAEAKQRDINEADTVTIIVDMLVDVFGYNRYTEITKEFAIRGTYCDLAVKIDSVPKILIEVKSIGLNLKDDHVRQATDYGVRENISWVVLTNGDDWRIYHVDINKSIKTSKIASFSIISSNYKDMVDGLFSLCREGIKKSAIEKLYEYQSIINKYCISSILLSDDIIKKISKDLKVLTKGIKIKPDKIIEILKNEIIKRDVIEDQQFDFFLKKVVSLKRKSKSIKKNKNNDMDESSPL